MTEMIMHYASIVLTIIAVLVAGVNIIVEVFKKLFPKLPTNILVFAVAIVVSQLTLWIWAAVAGFPVLWYYIVAAVILGVFVAYGAMFGFDKLKDTFQRFKKTE